MSPALTGRTSPSEFLASLEARDRRKAAKLLGSYIAMPDMSLDKFMKELWDLFSNIHEGLEELGEHMRHLGQSLREAPVYLADVRRALQLAGHLIDTIGCQGETRRQTQKALAEAKSFYNVARLQLVEGRTAGALERIRLAMERIALAAVEISRTCSDRPGGLPA